MEFTQEQEQIWYLDEEACEFLADTILANGRGEDITRITLSVGEVVDDDGSVQYGLRINETDYPEEGATLLAGSSRNAPLIDAAPAMYETIEAIALALRTGFDAREILGENSPIRDSIYAALAAARGEQ